MKKRKIGLLVLSLITINLLTGCTSSATNREIVNKNENTIETRYNVLEGYERTKVANDSFGEFLRQSKLKPYNSIVKYYNGKEKDPKGVYDSVFDVNIGKKNLHHCADAVMLLKGEYLYKYKRYDEINFNFVNGFNARFDKWIKGYRIKVDGNNVSWEKTAGYDDSYKSFREFMDIVFMYASTLSLEKEGESVKINDMQVGDVFVVGGSPGHAIIVVDMAYNKETNKKVFMVAQSYMPAQETQLLINPNNKNISPWYDLDFGEELKTPQWTFKKTELRRIVNS